MLRIVAFVFFSKLQLCSTLLSAFKTRALDYS
jgi:hypothetical protein